ncbi:MAG: phosphoribosylformylglycinamidine synthase subunit PurQ [Hymenobacter sp.]
MTPAGEPAQPTRPFCAGSTSLEVPVRHGEGRLVVPDAATRQRIEAAGPELPDLRRCHDGEATAPYPLNPNGADLNCAGLHRPHGPGFRAYAAPGSILVGRTTTRTGRGASGASKELREGRRWAGDISEYCGHIT